MNSRSVVVKMISCEWCILNIGRSLDHEQAAEKETNNMQRKRLNFRL